MKLTVATAALCLAEATVTSAATGSHSNSNANLLSSLHGQYPWQHQGRDASTFPQPNLKNGRQLEAVISSSLDQKTKEAHVMDIARTLLQNKKERAGSTSSSSRGQKLRSLIAKGRTHQLIDLVDQEEAIQECDPYSATMNNADVGILSCGQGRYCLESSMVSSAKNLAEFSFQGVCISMPDESTVELLDSMMLSPNEQGSRMLQSNGTSVIDDMYDICYGNMSDAYVDCDCEGVDVATYTGSLSCQYSEQICGDLSNVCGGNVTFCYQITYDLSVSAPYTFQTQMQYDFTSPTVFQYQYGVQYTGSPDPDSCTVSFDGTQCTSCEFTQILYDGDNAPTDCVMFDCGNTAMELSATVCDYSIVEMIIADYLLYKSLPCPDGCNLCGEGGYMTNLENNVTITNGQVYNCRLLGTAALAGYFATVEPDLCTLLPSVVADPCGCTGGDTIPPIGDNVTEAPTMTDFPSEMPVLAPVGIPSGPPVGGSQQATNPPAAAAGKSTLALVTTVSSVLLGWVFQQVMAA
jgi:hypothetical protein